MCCDVSCFFICAKCNLQGGSPSKQLVLLAGFGVFRCHCRQLLAMVAKQSSNDSIFAAFFAVCERSSCTVGGPSSVSVGSATDDNQATAAALSS